MECRWGSASAPVDADLRSRAVPLLLREVKQELEQAISNEGSKLQSELNALRSDLRSVLSRIGLGDAAAAKQEQPSPPRGGARRRRRKATRSSGGSTDGESSASSEESEDNIGDTEDSLLSRTCKELTATMTCPDLEDIAPVEALTLAQASTCPELSPWCPPASEVRGSRSLFDFERETGASSNSRPTHLSPVREAVQEDALGLPVPPAPPAKPPAPEEPAPHLQCRLLSPQNSPRRKTIGALDRASLSETLGGRAAGQTTLPGQMDLEVGEASPVSSNIADLHLSMGHATSSSLPYINFGGNSEGAATLSSLPDLGYPTSATVESLPELGHSEVDAFDDEQDLHVHRRGRKLRRTLTYPGRLEANQDEPSEMEPLVGPVSRSLSWKDFSAEDSSRKTFAAAKAGSKKEWGLRDLMSRCSTACSSLKSREFSGGRKSPRKGSLDFMGVMTSVTVVTPVEMPAPAPESPADAQDAVQRASFDSVSSTRPQDGAVQKASRFALPSERSRLRAHRARARRGAAHRCSTPLQPLEEEAERVTTEFGPAVDARLFGQSSSRDRVDHHHSSEVESQQSLFSSQRSQKSHSICGTSEMDLRKDIATCEFLRQKNEREIVDKVATAPVQVEEAKERQGTEKMCVDAFLRACGVLPWSSTWFRFSWVYQQLVLAAAAGTACVLVVRASHPSLDREAWDSSAAMDVMLSLGAVVGLLVCTELRSSRTLVKAQSTLESYAMRYGHCRTWGRGSCRDLGVSLLTWAGVVLVRALLTDPGDAHACFSLACFAFVGLLITGLACVFLHLCRGLTSVVDIFCNTIISQKEFPLVVREWNTVQASCRRVGNALQGCFGVLLLLGTLAVLKVVLYTSRNGSIDWSMMPGLLLMLATFRVSLAAGGVTDKCLHVPLLVNSVSTDVDLDMDRLYAVQYIQNSQAGFYVFEIRLTSSAVLRAFYLLGVVAVAIMTQLSNIGEALVSPST